MPERFIADGEECSIWEDYDGWAVYHKPGSFESPSDKGPMFFADTLRKDEVIQRVKEMDEWPPDEREEYAPGVKLAIEKEKRIR